MMRIFWPFILIVLAAACAANAGAPRTLSVASPAELIQAIAQAEGGDRILLATGTYGSIDIRNRNWSSTVTIASANPDKPAQIEMVSVNTASHLTLRSLEIGRPRRADEPDYLTLATFRNVDNLTLDSVFVRGSMDDTPVNDGNGINVIGSRHVTIKASRFEQLVRGLQMSASTDIVLTGNQFRAMRTDGMNFANVQRIRIEGNRFSDFFVGAGDHPDAIQFWTAGTKQASTDIIIRDNQILQGRGAGTQGIFLTDQVGTLPYERVKIENNLLYVYDGYNGIMVGHGKAVEILNNSVLSPPGDNEKYWIRLNRVEGAIIKGNIADTFVNQDNRGLDLKDNIFLEGRSGYGRRLPDLGANGDATPAGLITAGAGYQPPSR